MVAFVVQLYAQDPIQLPEITVVAKNYKYLNQTDSKDATLPVKLLQQKVANYDVKSQDFYSENYDYYTVSFYIPEGKVFAEYDSEGNIIRTIERYKDIALPKEITSAILKRFPKWTITKDIYLIRYNEKDGSKMKYKIALENGMERLKVKLDGAGNFL
ncbi:MAG: nicotinate-nucleotide adenylyltransferase [Flavobacteriaceae bacterium]|nr:nicotinate-nucleotide adenylyltransferase [Flavobacteriaceae bacterium]